MDKLLKYKVSADDFLDFQLIKSIESTKIKPMASIVDIDDLYRMHKLISKKGETRPFYIQIENENTLKVETAIVMSVHIHKGSFYLRLKK